MQPQIPQPAQQVEQGPFTEDMVNGVNQAHNVILEQRLSEQEIVLTERFNQQTYALADQFVQQMSELRRESRGQINNLSAQVGELNIQNNILQRKITNLEDTKTMLVGVINRERTFLRGHATEYVRISEIQDPNEKNTSHLRFLEDSRKISQTMQVELHI